MKCFKKIFITLMLLSIILLIGTITSNASSSDLYLQNLDFQVQINTDGSINVTETWDIEIEDTNTLYKTFKIDTSRFSDITNVQVTEITNGVNKQFKKINREMYHVTKNCYYGLINKNGDFEIAWGVGMDNSRRNKKI